MVAIQEVAEVGRGDASSGPPRRKAARRAASGHWVQPPAGRAPRPRGEPVLAWRRGPRSPQGHTAQEQTLPAAGPGTGAGCRRPRELAREAAAAATAQRRKAVPSITAMAARRSKLKGSRVRAHRPFRSSRGRTHALTHSGRSMRLHPLRRAPPPEGAARSGGGRATAAGCGQTIWRLGPLAAAIMKTEGRGGTGG